MTSLAEVKEKNKVWKPKDSGAYEAGRKRFEHALRTKGPDGIVKAAMQNKAAEAEVTKRAAIHEIECAAREVVNETSLRFGYSHIPAERWDAIFGQPESKNGAR